MTLKQFQQFNEENSNSINNFTIKTNTQTNLNNQNVKKLSLSCHTIYKKNNLIVSSLKNNALSLKFTRSKSW